MPKFSKFLKEFVEHRIPVWINNAFVAQAMAQNVPYILSEGENGKVTIVDGDTGVEQKQTQYSYGLHQFLQLKEGNKLSAESLKAVFVSNIGYFSGFRGRIFGITGTLGEKDAKKILSDLYDVDFFKMPRNKKKRCIQEPPQFFIHSEEQDYKKAISNCVEKRKIEQPILFICETVKQCKELNSHLKKTVEDPNLICIFESEEYDKFRESMETKKIEPGIVMISTNLFGRGTDINLSKNCEDKGLHVVLVYIPPNVRVQKQAFGRTARDGKTGSTEYIIHLAEGESVPDLETHFNQMNDKETRRLEHVNEKQVPQIQLEEKLFEEFAKEFGKIRKNFTITSKNKILETRLHIVKNRWAFWLDGIQSQIQMLHIKPEAIKAKIWEKYAELCKSLTQVTKSDLELCHSPSDFVKLAQAYEESGDLETSMRLLTRGIKEEPIYNEVLYYYRAVIHLKKEEKEGVSLGLRKSAREDMKMAVERVSARKDARFQSFGHFQTTLKNFLSKDKLPDLSNLRSQMEQERELLSHHECMFLHPAVGHSIDENSFKAIQCVNQEGAESKEIYNALVSDQNLMKPLRLSKKVQLDKKLGLVFKEQKPLDFKSLNLTLYEDRLTVLFKEMITKNNKTFVKGNLGANVVSLAEIMSAIKVAKIEMYNEKESRNETFKWLTEIKDYEVLTVSYDDFRFTTEFKQGETEPDFSVHKTTIGKLLGENNMKSLSQSVMEDLFQDILGKSNSAKLVDKLLEHNYLIKENHFTASIPPEHQPLLRYFNGELSGLPKSLLTYKSVLTTWLVDSSGKICPNLDTKSLKLVVPETNENESSTEREIDDVVSILISVGVLKRTKVKWSLSKWFQNEEERKEEIQAILAWQSPSETVSGSIIEQLRTTFHKFHGEEYIGSEDREKTLLEKSAGIAEKVLSFDFRDKTEEETGFENYLQSIESFLIDSVGKTKTLPKIKVESSSLAACFAGRETPEEYFALKEEGFDSVPVLKAKIPWWSNGAIWVALFGVLQIAAGVAVAVLSAGTLANVSMMLISEGGGDLIFAAHSGWQGSFSWKSYGIHKVFSVSCSIATGGLAGITGGSWGTIIAMELAEEIIKKTVTTVARYGAQAVGTAIANMTIEKALDWLRGKLMGGAKVLFQLWAKSNKAYDAARKRMEQSLRKLYAASFRSHQVETTVLNAKAELGPVGTSMFAHTLQSSMQRVANFYMAKVTEKINSAMGQGIMSNIVKLISMFGSALFTMTRKIVNPIQKFATDYVIRLSKYYEKEAKTLEKRSQQNCTFATKSDEKEMKRFIAVNMENVDGEVVDSGLKMLQHEIAEPALKQMSARWFDSKLGKSVKEQFGGNQSSAYLKELDKITVPSSFHLNTRLGFDDENKVRNNIWDTAFATGAIDQVQNYWEDLQMIKEWCSITTKSGGKGNPIINFMLDGASPQMIWQAEKIGVNFVRKFSTQNNS